MKKIWTAISNHRTAIIVAVIIGGIIAFPHIYFRYKNKSIYHNIGLGGADEAAYLSRIQEVRDGHYRTANYVWLEGKDLPYLLPSLSEIVTNIPGWIFGLNITDTVTLGRFIFPAFVFLLIYTLLYQSFGKKIIALTAATAVLLSTELIDPGNLIKLLFKGQPVGRGFLPFSRLVAPQVHLIFFFGFLLLFWLFIMKQKGIYKYLSGFVLGLSFYTYPYTWTFLFAFLGFLVLINLWQKNWPAIKDIIIISLIALLVAIPYLFNLWQAINHPIYSEISMRHGVVNTHQPQLGAVVLIILGIFLLFFPRREKKDYPFFLALAFSPLIVLNQQIITGHILIPDHYHWYYHKPLAIIFLIIIAFSLIDKLIKKDNFRKVISGGLAALVFLVSFYNALAVQTTSYRFREELAKKLNQNYGPVFDWLNNNANKDEVAVGNGMVAYLIPMYTHLNSATAEDGHYMLVADENQVLERVFLELRLDGLTGEKAEELFFQERKNISAEIYGQFYRKQAGGYDKIPDQKLSWLAEQYRAFMDMSIGEILHKYQIDYIIWDTLEDPHWQIEQCSFLKEIYQNKGIKVFKVL